jgi:hypothetical protein
LSIKDKPRQIVLIHWNAGVFTGAALPQLLPELVVYGLLYDEVLIREEDLLTNRQITGYLSQPENIRVFEELLASGVVKLLRLPVSQYPLGRRFDPVRLPVSARAEEHERRRSYKGRPWRATPAEWKLFECLDRIVADNASASRFHAPFPDDNPFALQVAELLEYREDYSFGAHPVFRYIHPRTAETFIRFCREPDAWQRFLHEARVKEVIVGPDGGFYRSAAYQCLRLLPTPRATRRLVESVYAATYCAREDADGRYGGGELIELPYRFATAHDQEAARESLTRVEVVPTTAVLGLSIEPGVAAVLGRTRETDAFVELRRVLTELGGSQSELGLPSETTFREAWRNICAAYADNATRLLTTPSTLDKGVTRSAIWSYIGARVLGFIMIPLSPYHTELAVPVDAAAIWAMEHWGPTLTRGFRAMLKVPPVQQALQASARVRCSRVPLNTLRRS